MVVCRTDSALKFGWFFFTYLVSFSFDLVIFSWLVLTHPKEEEEMIVKRLEMKMQFHIGFCVFAAVAPPIIFKGKSLT